MSTEQAAIAMPLDEGTAYRLVYYYEGDFTELNTSEEMELALYMKSLHFPDEEVYDISHTENLRRVEVIEDPDEYYDVGSGEITRMEKTDSGIITLDVSV